MKRVTLGAGRVLGLTATAVATAALAACGSSGSSASSGAPSNSVSPGSLSTGASSSAAPSTGLPSSPGSVKIGSAAFPESALLADLYGDAMAAKGVKVSKQLNIGERGVYIAALKDGSIGAVPEYTGSILSFLDP